MITHQNRSASHEPPPLPPFGHPLPLEWGEGWGEGAARRFMGRQQVRKKHGAFREPSLPGVSRRVFVRGGLALSIAAVFPYHLWGAERRGRYELRAATLVPDGTSIDQILRAMGEQWLKAPEGGVLYTPCTGATMGTEGDVLRRMRVGQLQAGVLMSSGLALIDPGMTCLQTMPFIFRSFDEVAHVCDRMLPTFQERMRAKGFELLFLTDAGWIRYFSKRPAVLPEDFKRLKMFASVDDREYIDLMRT